MATPSNFANSSSTPTNFPSTSSNNSDSSTTADQWQVSNNTTADQWQVSNNITADQRQVSTSEGQNEMIRMASDFQLAVSIVIILVAFVVVIVLVALINRRRIARRHLGAATKRLVPLGPEPPNQEERIPGRRVIFSRS